MTDEGTPRPWGLGVKPTPDQMASWLAICTHDERAAFARHALRSMDEAHECFVRNHAGSLERMEAIVTKLCLAYEARRPLWWNPDTDQMVVMPL